MAIDRRRMRSFEDVFVARFPGETIAKGPARRGCSELQRGGANGRRYKHIWDANLDRVNSHVSGAGIPTAKQVTLVRAYGECAPARRRGGTCCDRRDQSNGTVG